MESFSMGYARLTTVAAASSFILDAIQEAITEGSVKKFLNS